MKLLSSLTCSPGLCWCFSFDLSHHLLQAPSEDESDNASSGTSRSISPQLPARALGVGGDVSAHATAPPRSASSKALQRMRLTGQGISRTNAPKPTGVHPNGMLFAPNRSYKRLLEVGRGGQGAVLCVEAIKADRESGKVCAYVRPSARTSLCSPCAASCRPTPHFHKHCL